MSHSTIINRNCHWSLWPGIAVDRTMMDGWVIDSKNTQFIIINYCCSKEVEWMECHFTTIYGSGVKFPRREHDRVNQHLSGACNYICTYISKLQTPSPAPKWLVGRPSRKNSWPKVHSHNMYTQSFNSDVLFFVSSIVDHQPPTTSTTPSIRPSVQEANYPNITSEDWNVVSIKLFRPE